jgi:hypothetical protein
MNHREIAHGLLRVTMGVIFLFYGIGKFMGGLRCLTDLLPLVSKLTGTSKNFKVDLKTIRMAAATVGFSAAGRIFTMRAAILSSGGHRTLTWSVRACVCFLCVIHCFSPLCKFLCAFCVFRSASHSFASSRITERGSPQRTAVSTIRPLARNSFPIISVSCSACLMTCSAENFCDDVFIALDRAKELMAQTGRRP